MVWRMGDLPGSCCSNAPAILEARLSRFLQSSTDPNVRTNLVNEIQKERYLQKPG